MWDWLKTQQQITTLIWVDDDLHRTHQAGRELDEPEPDRRPLLADFLVESIGVTGVVLAPATTVGLSPADLNQIQTSPPLGETGTFDSPIFPGQKGILASTPRTANIIERWIQGQSVARCVRVERPHELDGR